MSGSYLGATHDSEGIANNDRKKVLEFYKLMLKYGRESNDDNDAIENTKESYCRLCGSTSIKEMNGVEAKKKMNKISTEMGLGLFEKAKTNAMWVVCSALSMQKYGHRESVEKSLVVSMGAFRS